MGTHMFGREAQRKIESPNRDLLTKFCLSNDFIIANTLYEHAAESTVTHHELAVAPMSPINETGFARTQTVGPTQGGNGF